MAISGSVLRQLSDGIAELYAPAGAPGGLDYAARVVNVASRILQLVADGQSDRGIARTLGISTRTVQAHLQRTYRTLDVSSRTEALARLRALGATPSLSLPGRRVRS